MVTCKPEFNHHQEKKGLPNKMLTKGGHISAPTHWWYQPMLLITCFLVVCNEAKKKKPFFLFLGTCVALPKPAQMAIIRWTLSGHEENREHHGHPGRLWAWFSCVLIPTQAHLSSKRHDSSILNYCIISFLTARQNS